MYTETDIISYSEINIILYTEIDLILYTVLKLTLFYILKLKLFYILNLMLFYILKMTLFYNTEIEVILKFPQVSPPLVSVVTTSLIKSLQTFSTSCLLNMKWTKSVKIWAQKSVQQPWCCCKNWKDSIFSSCEWLALLPL